MAKLSGHWARVLVDGKNMSTNTQSVDVASDHDAHEATGLDEVHNFIPGQRTVSVAHNGLMDWDTSGNAGHDQYNDGAAGVVTVLVGQNAAPAAGDPAFVLNALEGAYGVNVQNAAAVSFSANLSARGDDAGKWGKTLSGVATITNTTTGGSVDDSASSAGGAIASLHVLSALTTDTYAVKVQDSTDGSTWADLITFSADASAVAGEFQTVTGTVDRYLHYVATRSGTYGESLSLTVALARL